MTTTRTRLPKRRRSLTLEATVGGPKNQVFITCGERDDGELAEIFINLHKEGSAFQTLMNCFAILVSLCLQHGVPLSLLVKRFSGVKFEPSGAVVGHPEIDSASSVVDYIFRALESAYPEKKA